MGPIASIGEDACVRLHVPHWVLKVCRVKYSAGRCLWQRDWTGQGRVACTGVTMGWLWGLQPVGWQAHEKVKLASSEEVFGFGTRSVHFHLHFFFVSKELSQSVFLEILLIYFHLEELELQKERWSKRSCTSTETTTLWCFIYIYITFLFINLCSCSKILFVPDF